jgi:hypothetical protein
VTGQPCPNMIKARGMAELSSPSVRQRSSASPARLLLVMVTAQARASGRIIVLKKRTIASKFSTFLTNDLEGIPVSVASSPGSEWKCTVEGSAQEQAAGRWRSLAPNDMSSLLSRTFCWLVVLLVLGVAGRERPELDTLSSDASNDGTVGWCLHEPLPQLTSRRTAPGKRPGWVNSKSFRIDNLKALSSVDLPLRRKGRDLLHFLTVQRK